MRNKTSLELESMVEFCLPYQEQPFTKDISLHIALKTEMIKNIWTILSFHISCGKPKSGIAR